MATNGERVSSRVPLTTCQHEGRVGREPRTDDDRFRRLRVLSQDCPYRIEVVLKGVRRVAVGVEGGQAALEECMLRSRRLDQLPSPLSRFAPSQNLRERSRLTPWTLSSCSNPSIVAVRVTTAPVKGEAYSSRSWSRELDQGQEELITRVGRRRDPRGVEDILESK